VRAIGLRSGEKALRLEEIRGLIVTEVCKELPGEEKTAEDGDDAAKGQK
jgi:hypothetical protein